MHSALFIMKNLNVIGVIVTVTIIALAGIVTIVVAAVASLLLVQSASATNGVVTTPTSVGGGDQQAVNDTTTTTNTNNNVSNALLGRLFSYGEGQGMEANVNPINETYSEISYSGNRIIIPPNTTGVVINASERGNFTINIQPNGLSFYQGHAVIMTEGGAAAQEQENATITFVLLTRTNPDGSGSGTSVTYFSTNSTGQLAFLDNMVAIGQVEYSPEEGINRFREWEWKGAAVPFEIGSGGGAGAATTTENQTNITTAPLEEKEE